MVESSGLENRRTGNRTVGSNPTSSANWFAARHVMLVLVATAVILAFAHLEAVAAFGFWFWRKSEIQSAR